MLSTALECLSKGGKRHERVNEYACSFTYVTLNRAIVDHNEFFALIDDIASSLKLEPVHARLSLYSAGDYCAKHVDTIPNVKYAVSIRLDIGTPKLVVGDRTLSEGGHQAIIFNPHIEHEVLACLPDEQRVVLNFWLV